MKMCSEPSTTQTPFSQPLTPTMEWESGACACEPTTKSGLIVTDSWIYIAYYSILKIIKVKNANMTAIDKGRLMSSGLMSGWLLSNGECPISKFPTYPQPHSILHNYWFHSSFVKLAYTHEVHAKYLSLQPAQCHLSPCSPCMPIRQT